MNDINTLAQAFFATTRVPVVYYKEFYLANQMYIPNRQTDFQLIFGEACTTHATTLIKDSKKTKEDFALIIQLYANAALMLENYAFESSLKELISNIEKINPVLITEYSGIIVETIKQSLDCTISKAEICENVLSQVEFQLV